MTDTWVGTSGGDWNVGSNWSNGVAPGSKDDYSDDVDIDTSGLQYIDLYNTNNSDYGYDIGALTVGSSDEVSLVGGNMTVEGAVTTPGNLDVDQGFELDLEGAGDTQTVDNTGTIFVAGTVRLGAGDGSGTVDFTGAGQLDLFGGSLDGISFSGLESDNDIYGSGTINVESLQNDGIVEADNGTLTVQTYSAIQNTGIIGADAAGSTLDLQADVDNLDGASIFADASGAQVVIDGATIFGGDLVSFNGGSIAGEAYTALDGTTLSGVFETQSYKGFLLDDNTMISEAATLEGTSGASIYLNGGRIVSDGSDAGLVNATLLFGTGGIGDGLLTLDNEGTIEASGGQLTLALSASDLGTNFNESGARIIAAKNASISIGTGDPNGSTFENDGSLIAYTGGSLVIGQGAEITNFQGSELVGGIYEAAGNGATLELNQYVSSLDATMILNGAGSYIESSDNGGGTIETLGAMLSTIVKGGKLEVLGGRNFETVLPTFTVQGTLEMSGGIFQLGGGSASRLIVQSGGDIELAGTGGITLASGSKGYASVNKGGKLEKLSGGGTSLVGVAVANGGVVIAGSGVLDFGAAVNGTGHDYVEKGATLEFAGAVAKTQAFAFATGGGTLQLADAKQFAGTIARLGAGDTIDVDGLGSGTTFSFVENAGKTQGVLTLKHGSTVDTLTLVGTYASSGFKLTTGASGDTRVTYAAPKPQEAPAASAAGGSHAAALAQSLFEAAFAPAGGVDTSASTHAAGLQHPLAAASFATHGHA